MNTTLRFDDRVALVTGAGSNPGLGRSYALLLAGRGAKVVVNDLGVGPDGRGVRVSNAEAVAQEIRDAGGDAIADTRSVAESASAAGIVAAAIDAWGRIDIVVNNAGIAPFALFDEISDADINRIVGVHLMGHIWICRAAWPHMKAQRYGRIVNVSSGVALAGMPYQSVYAAAKLGIVGLTRVLASEGLAHGIRANAIMPGAETAAWQLMLGDEWNRQAVNAGLTPERVAPITAFLAHESCPFTGKTIQASGGAASEALFATTVGIPPDSDLSVEGVRDNIERITDRESARFLSDPDGVIPPALVPHPYEPA